MPNPRDLDPNFTEAKPPVEETPEKDVPMLVHQVRFIDENGVQQTKEHRVPVSEWPAYEKEHGF